LSILNITKNKKWKKNLMIQNLFSKFRKPKDQILHSYFNLVCLKKTQMTKNYIEIIFRVGIKKEKIHH
jgi:hypothetical protein